MGVHAYIYRSSNCFPTVLNSKQIQNINLIISFRIQRDGTQKIIEYFGQHSMPKNKQNVSFDGTNLGSVFFVTIHFLHFV